MCCNRFPASRIIGSIIKEIVRILYCRQLCRISSIQITELHRTFAGVIPEIADSFTLGEIQKLRHGKRCRMLIGRVVSALRELCLGLDLDIAVAVHDLDNM